MKIRIKKKKNLEEMSSMSGGSVQGYAGSPLASKEETEQFNRKQEKDQRLKGKKLTEMYSTRGMSGRNKQQVVSGEKEHAGHVERSKHQGLLNVMENDDEETLSFVGPTELSDFGSNLQQTSPTARKAVKDAGYRFVDYLGGGQFGKVFKVKNPALNREEAMKIVTGTPNSTNREVRNYQLIQDARTKSETLAKHFPETYAAWKQDGFGFIAMEILEPVQYSDEAMLVDKTNLRSAEESDRVADVDLEDQSFKAKQWFDTTFLDSLAGNSDKIEAHALQGIQVSDDVDNGDLLFYTSPTFMRGLKAQAEGGNLAFSDKIDEHLSIFLNNPTSFPETARILGIVKDETPDAPHVPVALGVIANVIMNIRGNALQQQGQQLDVLALDRVISNGLVAFVKGYREFSTMRIGYDKKGPKVATGTEKESWDKVIKELYDVTGLVARDVHYGNVMQRPNGDLVIVDLGLFKMQGDTPGLFESKKYKLKILRK